MHVIDLEELKKRCIRLRLYLIQKLTGLSVWTLKLTAFTLDSLETRIRESFFVKIPVVLGVSA